jgi:hypothetical protein
MSGLRGRGTEARCLRLLNQDRSGPDVVGRGKPGLGLLRRLLDELCDCRPESLGRDGVTGGLEMTTPRPRTETSRREKTPPGRFAA